MYEFQQTVSLRILGAILWYCSQYRICVISHNREFHKIGGVEHHIRILLIWIDPLFFSFKPIRPLLNGLAGGKCPLVVIPDNTPQQTVVAGRNAVVVIQTDAGERGNENPELAAVLDFVSKPRIEGVYSLYNQHASFAQALFLAVVLAHSGSEIV